MSPELINSPLVFAAIAFGLAGLILLFGGVAALMRARPLRSALRTLTGLLMLLCAATAGMLAIGLQGYQTLTHEEIAAHITVHPLGAQHFAAAIRFADGRETVYEVAGDEVYIDAHILKWQPFANLLGLHTSYELDRLGGRYHAIDQERTAPRTVYSLTQHKPIDLFSLRQRYAFLAPVVDAEYGSATFVPVTGPAQFEVRVSTTGLLMRNAKPAQK